MPICRSLPAVQQLYWVDPAVSRTEAKITTIPYQMCLCASEIKHISQGRSNFSGSAICYSRRPDCAQGRIQEFIFGGPNQGPQSRVKGEARIEGAKRPSIEGEVRVEGAECPRIESEAQTEGEARKKSGRGVWGGGSVSPSP